MNTARTLVALSVVSLGILFVLPCVPAPALPGLCSPAMAAALTHGSVGAGRGINVPGDRTNPCNGTLLLNYDGSAEDGFCWSYGGIVPPQYGAFAECYNYNGQVCGIELQLTAVPGYSTHAATLFVWNDDQGIPGTVLAQADVTPTGVPIWPSVGTYDYPISAVVTGSFWVGYWADFSHQGCGYYVAADRDGPGGCPMTCVAPGLGYPTGWTNTSEIWGPTTALGIGAWTSACLPGGPGACCLPDGSCSVTQLGPCESGGGLWFFCTPCSPSPCPANSSVAAGAAPAGKSGDLAAYPNPSRGPVMLCYRLHQDADVSLEIFDARGSAVRRLATGSQPAGLHTIRWDGRDDAGARLPAGTYFARSRTASGTTMVKVVLTN